jgi:hypothetical protein
MVETVLMYGTEIWGWKEHEGVLGVDRETPGYIVREECKRNRLRVKGRKKWESLRIT